MALEQKHGWVVEKEWVLVFHCITCPSMGIRHSCIDGLDDLNANQKFNEVYFSIYDGL